MRATFPQNARGRKTENEVTNGWPLALTWRQIQNWTRCSNARHRAIPQVTVLSPTEVIWSSGRPISPPKRKRALEPAGRWKSWHHKNIPIEDPGRWAPPRLASSVPAIGPLVLGKPKVKIWSRHPLTESTQADLSAKTINLRALSETWPQQAGRSFVASVRP